MTGRSNTATAAGVLPAGRRRKLLDTAAAEFIAHGYRGASLNRIIAAESMSKSSFYHYFSSKGALFDAVVTQLGQVMAATLEVPHPQTLAADGFWDGIASLVSRMARLSEEGSLAQMAGLFYLPDAPQDTGVGRIRDAIDAWVEAALQAGRECGAVRTDLPVPLLNRLTKAVLWTMDQWSVAHLRQTPETASGDAVGADAERLAAAQLDVVRRMLEPRS